MVRNFNTAASTERKLWVMNVRRRKIVTSVSNLYVPIKSCFTKFEKSTTYVQQCVSRWKINRARCRHCWALKLWFGIIQCNEMKNLKYCKIGLLQFYTVELTAASRKKLGFISNMFHFWFSCPKPEENQTSSKHW